MLAVSDLLINKHDLSSFAALLTCVQQCARDGAMWINIDIRPPFPDTPERWEQAIENAFTSA